MFFFFLFVCLFACLFCFGCGSFSDSPRYFYGLDSVGEGRSGIFLGRPLLELSNVILMVRLGAMGWWVENHGGKWPFSMALFQKQILLT